MAPSADCAANLFCSEDAFGCLSDDDTGSFFEDGHADASAKALLLDDPADVRAALSLLVETEVCHRPQADYLHKFHSKDLDASSRQNAIDWLYEARALYNFSPLTAALSVNYLDRFLSRHHLLPNGKTWMLQLVSVACLSLATKMEETKVPLLLDLQVAREVPHMLVHEIDGVRSGMSTSSSLALVSKGLSCLCCTCWIGG